MESQRNWFLQGPTGDGKAWIQFPVSSSYDLS